MKISMRQVTNPAEVTLRLVVDLTLHEAELLRNVIPAGTNAPALSLRQSLTRIVDTIRKDYESEVAL